MVTWTEETRAFKGLLWVERERRFLDISIYVQVYSTANFPLLLSSGLMLNVKWQKGKVASPRNQDKLYVKNLHGGGTADIGYYTHMLLCVSQVHLKSELCGRALGCSPCIASLSRNIKAWVGQSEMHSLHFVNSGKTQNTLKLVNSTIWAAWTTLYCFPFCCGHVTFDSL